MTRSLLLSSLIHSIGATTTDQKLVLLIRDKLAKLINEYSHFDGIAESQVTISTHRVIFNYETLDCAEFLIVLNIFKYFTKSTDAKIEIDDYDFTPTTIDNFNTSWHYYGGEYFYGSIREYVQNFEEVKLTKAKDVFHEIIQ